MDLHELNHIRPAGRHLLTIGSELIQDKYAALVELVKNAYDADSPDVEISFKLTPDRKNLTLSIVDRGHGMSRDTIIDKWLVPSTDDKLIRKISPKGRIMQGSKGIGRYAASILGESLLLQTVTESGEKTQVLIYWDDFKEAKYLDEVDILVQTSETKEPAGTSLIISGSQSYVQEWTQDQIDKLKFELKKLLPPIETNYFTSFEENFEIILSLYSFYENQEKVISEKIKPFPIFDLFDYQICGEIKKSGEGSLTFKNQRIRNSTDEKIEFSLKKETGCGNLFIDIRVFDRDTASIDELIKRGLKDDTGKYVERNQARIILDIYNGIGVYRNGFRIRPLGDSDFDWLTLNKLRVQNPSRKIGSDQAIGYVIIQPEEFSGLQEKSARDGLKENIAYENLKSITAQVISILEERRFVFRQKIGIGRRTFKVESDLQKLFSFDEIKIGVRKKLLSNGLSPQAADEIIGIITKKEKESNEIVENIRQYVAIYQGQATLGKIINVVLHEGRKPLQFFKDQIPNLDYWTREFRNGYTDKAINEILPISEGLSENSRRLVDLFKRLDPLAAGKRGKKTEFNLLQAIEGAAKVFESEFTTNSIKIDIKCSENISFFGWRGDIYAIFTNLIDNSVYWLKSQNKGNRKININVISTKEVFFVDYTDTGPGIEDYLIESEVIFDPEFSTKPNGTGLGLAIAGEAALRNNLELKAYSSKSGVYFRLQKRGIFENDTN